MTKKERNQERRKEIKLIAPKQFGFFKLNADVVAWKTTC